MDFKPSYDICVGLNYQLDCSVGITFIKRSAILEAEKSIRSQLRVMNFSEDSPFETLHSYIRDAVTPYRLSLPPRRQSEFFLNMYMAIEDNVRVCDMNSQLEIICACTT